MARGDAAAAEPLDEAMRALAEPRRRAILRLVAHDELAAGEIAAAFDVTRTAVSQHLTVLKTAGLLTERRDGTRRLYRARPEGLAGLREFLEEMWGSSLDVARRLVEEDRTSGGDVRQDPRPTRTGTGPARREGTR
ncbi:ArsR/SmtB family transcription factor [Blastococcus sp. SYSU D00669]